MGHNGCLVFCQITVDQERRASRHIVVMQHSSLICPQIRPISAHSDPSTR
jgi:hypothetical protein